MQNIWRCDDISGYMELWWDFWVNGEWWGEKGGETHQKPSKSVEPFEEEHHKTPQTNWNIGTYNQKNNNNLNYWCFQLFRHGWVLWDCTVFIVTSGEIFWAQAKQPIDNAMGLSDKPHISIHIHTDPKNETWTINKSDWYNCQILRFD